MVSQMRYGFEPGSGVCLWADNALAKAQYGYAVEHWDLPLSENDKRYLDYLIAWFDTSIDWLNPGASEDYWSPAQRAAFNIAATKGLELIRQGLGKQVFILVDGLKRL